MNAGNLANIFRRAMVGIWLVMLYSGCIWLVFGSFSTHQLQYKIQTELEQDIATVSSVIRLLGEFRRIDQRILAKTVRIKAVEEAMEKLLSEAEQVEEKLDDLRARAGMSRETGPHSEPLPPKTNQDRKTEPAVERAAASVDLKARISAKKVELRRMSRRFAEKKILLESEKVDLKWLTGKRNHLETSNAGIQDYLTELASMQRFHFDALATIPSQLLTQILILSMGALGSLIYLTRAFLTPRLFKPFSWYFFRPFLGMVTALAMFVLTKSGLGIVSGENAAASLNPFVISFIAIISGVLSEQAYERIHRAGESFFKAEKRQQRWSLFLMHEMEKQGKTGDGMQPFVDASPKIIEEWVAGTTPVPADAQKVIAAWVGKPARELFSDQPPGVIEDSGGHSQTPPPREERDPDPGQIGPE